MEAAPDWPSVRADAQSATLEGVRDHFNILTNLSHLEADSKGDGSGDHNRAAGAWLTGVHAWDRTLPGGEIRLATSADQIAARHLGKDSRVSSIEMTLDPATQGACDSGDCFYVNTVSWRSETSPNMPEIHPRVIFERLFGDGGSAEQRRARIRQQGSILDSVLEETRTLTATLGRSDTSKVNEYLDSVREVEQRIQHAESSLDESVELPDRPIGIPASFEDYAQLMFDLQLLAFPQRHHAGVLADHGARAEWTVLQPNRSARQPSPDLASS
jgi:hypothetical protein